MDPATAAGQTTPAQRRHAGPAVYRSPPHRCRRAFGPRFRHSGSITAAAYYLLVMCLFLFVCSRIVDHRPLQ